MRGSWTRPGAVFEHIYTRPGPSELDRDTLCIDTMLATLDGTP